MTDYSPILQNGAFLVDNAFLEYATTCVRKTQYRYVMSKVSKGEKDALNFGSAIHRALEYRYSVVQNRQMTEADEQVVHNRILVPFFEEHIPSEDSHRNLNWAFELFKHYNKAYPVEPFKLMTWKEPKPCHHCNGTGHDSNDGCIWCKGSGKQSIMSEITFIHDIHTYNGIPIKYIGRIDLPVIWNDVIIVNDHKTASMLGNFYFEGQKISPQFEGYCWAMQQTIKSPIVSGFCINALRTKEPPMKPKSGWDQWWSECFARHKEYLRPGQLDEWKENTIQLIEEWMWHYERGYFPMKKKACTMYGKCPYYDVCYLPKENRELVLNSTQFTEEKWTPLKDYENKEKIEKP